MSTLRTNNLQNPDSAGVNIVMTEGGGAIFSGIVTAPTLNVTGVLTYDDVTNIDSVGLVTARSGLHVTGGDVGIGTDTNLTAKLTVGNIENTGVTNKGATAFKTLNSSGGVGEAAIYIEEQSGNEGWYLKVNSSGDLQLNDSGISDRITFQDGGNVGIGTDSPASLVHALGSYGTVRVENNNTAQYAASGIELKGPAGDERSTKIIHGNSNTGGTETYFQIEQYNAAGSYVKTLSQYNYQYDYWAFNTGGTQRLQITSDGSTYTGGSTITESDMNWTHNAYQRPHIFTGATGGNPSDGAIVVASPETEPSATRVGSVIFGCKTSSTTGVSNSGLKAVIDSYTNTNVGDAWKTGADLRFKTRPDNGNILERVRITSDGKLLSGVETFSPGTRAVFAGNSSVAEGNGVIFINRGHSNAMSGGDGIGNIEFGNSTGNIFARISAEAGTTTGAAGSNDYPGQIKFWTTADGGSTPTERMRIYANGAVTKPTNPILKVNSTATYGAYQSLHVSPAVSIAQATAQINIGDNGWTTTGSNAYTFVCPVDGIYALHAHISLANITAGNRVIWSMAYTLGGGNLPLSNYVEVIDTNVFDYQNASYYDTWYFTAGTRVGMGINSSTGGALSGLGFSWGMHLLQ